MPIGRNYFKIARTEAAPMKVANLTDEVYQGTKTYIQQYILYHL